MFDRRQLLIKIGLGLIGFFTTPLLFDAMAPAVAAKSPASKTSPLAAFDKDNDGTLDLEEVKAAASAAFDKLNKDSDETLDRKEIGNRLSRKEFEAADPDKDKTLTKDEYLAEVEKRFKAADTDHDGTLDAKELKTKAGRALLRLLK